MDDKNKWFATSDLQWIIKRIYYLKIFHYEACWLEQKWMKYNGDGTYKYEWRKVPVKKVNEQA